MGNPPRCCGAPGHFPSNLCKQKLYDKVLSHQEYFSEEIRVVQEMHSSQHAKTYTLFAIGGPYQDSLAKTILLSSSSRSTRASIAVV